MIALPLAFLAEVSPVCSTSSEPDSRCFWGAEDEDATPVTVELDMGFSADVGGLEPAICVT